LWLFSLWRCPRWVIVIAILLLGLTVAAWLAPTVVLSGGLGAYLEASRSIGGGVLSNFELFGGGQSLLTSLGPFVRLGMYLVYGLMLGLVPLLYGVTRGLGNIRTLLGQWLPDSRVHVIVLWLAPNLILYAPLVRAPGHTFSFMPALVLLAATALGALSRDLSGRLSWSATRSTMALTSLILIVNVVFFLAAPPYLFEVRRVVTTTPSWSTLQYRDRYLAERVAYITQHFDADATVIAATGPDFRHPDYYLRDYDALNHGGEVLPSDIPAGSRTLVFFSDDLVSGQSDVQVVVLPSGELLFYLQLDANSAIIDDELEASVRAQAYCRDTSYSQVVCLYGTLQVLNR
jgi:hypothetical protein